MTVSRLASSVLLAAAFLAALTARASAQAEKRVALVVGNSAYQHVTRLANPENDARLMADTLRSLGFSLVGDGPQLDLDKAGFERAAQAFGRQLQGADVGLFYYAGHGVQVRGANYLVPVGANPVREADVDFQMLDTNLVLRQMEGAGTKLNLVILDACRNNPFGGRGLRSAGSGLATMQAPEGTLISFATQPGNVALDGTEGNSPYTRALAQAIRKPGLGLFDAFNEVGLAVKQATGGAQQPWVSSSPISGTFFFAGLPAGGTAVTPPAPPSPPAPALAADEVFWLAIRDSKLTALFEEFLSKFPASPRAPLARQRLNELKALAAVPPPSVPPPPAAPPPVASTRLFRVLDNVSDGILNMRTGAGTRYPIVASIPAGSSDLNVGRCRPPDDGVGANWCEVQWRGLTGWVSSCCMAEVAAPVRRTFRVLDNVSQGVLNMRRGPGQRFDIVVAIPAGAADVSVGRCRSVSDGSRMPWCEVSWRGHSGWASACCMVDVRTGALARADD